MCIRDSYSDLHKPTSTFLALSTFFNGFLALHGLGVPSILWRTSCELRTKAQRELLSQRIFINAQRYSEMKMEYSFYFRMKTSYRMLTELLQRLILSRNRLVLLFPDFSQLNHKKVTTRGFWQDLGSIFESDFTHQT